jgi:hypothetical protein
MAMSTEVAGPRAPAPAQHVSAFSLRFSRLTEPLSRDPQQQTLTKVLDLVGGAESLFFSEPLFAALILLPPCGEISLSPTRAIQAISLCKNGVRIAKNRFLILCLPLIVSERASSEAAVVCVFSARSN